MSRQKGWGRGVALAVVLACGGGCAPGASDEALGWEPSEAREALPPAGSSRWTPCGLTARLVKDLNPGPAGQVAFDLEHMAGRLFFAGQEGALGRELWATTGEAAGTVLVKDIRPGSEGSLPTALLAVGGTLFFGADDGVNGRELWRSDGTEAGTVLVKDLRPGPGSSSPFIPVELDGIVSFIAVDDAHGREVWRSDGTEAGTFLLVDFLPGPDFHFISHLFVWQGALHAVVTGGGTSTLWRMDGTVEGKVALASFAGTAITAVAPAGNHRLFFQVDAGGDSAHLYVTNGTPGAERLLRTLTAPGEMVGMDGRLLFSADGPAGEGQELWRSNGTPEGTVLVEDLRPGPAGSRPHFLTVMEDRLYFVADDGAHGEEPWRSDGRAAGTRLLKDVAPGATGSTPLGLTAIEGTLFFTAETAGHGREVWLSQGTSSSTRAVEDIAPGPLSSVGLGGFTRSGWDVFFLASDGSTGSELWALPFRPRGRCHSAR